MASIESFFREIDVRWSAAASKKIPLRIIGCGALILQCDYERGTKDSDVLETLELGAETKGRLLELAGKETEIHARHRLYLDIVPNGLPFLPQAPRWHPLTELSASLHSFDLAVLAIVDVVVSKLKRFSANDASDIRAMVDRDLVDHDELVSRFRSAVDVFSMDARAPDLRRYVRNLHQVERDLLLVKETEIELPSWI